MNGRIYDPLIGRFLSADPFVPNPGNLQDFNRYSYVRNNPLRFVDPSGYNPKEDQLRRDVIRAAEQAVRRGLSDAVGAVQAHLAMGSSSSRILGVGVGQASASSSTVQTPTASNITRSAGERANGGTSPNPAIANQVAPRTPEGGDSALKTETPSTTDPTDPPAQEGQVPKEEWRLFTDEEMKVHGHRIKHVNTIVTDGNGGLMVNISENNLKHAEPEVLDVIRAHESVHIQDALAFDPAIAVGQPAGIPVRTTSNYASAMTEIRATAVEISMLEGLLAGGGLSSRATQQLTDQLAAARIYRQQNIEKRDRALEALRSK